MEDLIYAVVLAIKGVCDSILAQWPADTAGRATVESTPYAIEDNTTDIRAVTEALTTWESDTTAQISGVVDAVNLLQSNTSSPHPATLTDILAAFGDIPVYTLPSTPPPGYGGTTFGDVISWQMCALD
jgi:hypothetical protein